MTSDMDFKEKKLEVIHRERMSKLARLTLALDRITIKYAPGVSSDEEREIKNFFLGIAEKMQGHPYSLRGHLGLDGKISLSGTDGKVVATFLYEQRNPESNRW